MGDEKGWVWVAAYIRIERFAKKLRGDVQPLDIIATLMLRVAVEIPCLIVCHFLC